MPSFPVFVRRGDALPEVDAIVRELGGPEAAGLHRQMYVTRADQTVVMTTTADSALAVALRVRPGWAEPKEP